MERLRFIHFSTLAFAAITTGCAKIPSSATQYQFADVPSQVNDGSRIQVPAQLKGITWANHGLTSTTTVNTSGWPFNVNTNPTSTTTSTSTTNTFSSGTLAACPGVVIQLYRTLVAMEPAPNSDGVLYWIAEIIRGRPLGGIANAFSTSPAATQYSSVTNMQDVNALSRVMLGRVATNAEITTYLTDMSSGSTLGNIVGLIYNTPEHQTIGADTFFVAPAVEEFRSIVNRDPSSDEINSFLSYVINGNSYSNIAGMLRASSEAKNLGGANAENIIAVYRTITCNLPSSSDLSYWVSQNQDTTTAASGTNYNNFLAGIAQRLINQQINGTPATN